MTRLVVSAEAKADVSDILDYLALNAGPRTAAAYAERFASAVERIMAHPGSAPARPKLGADTRVVIVYPYLMIYDFVAAADTATLLRVLHGRRNITEQAAQAVAQLPYRTRRDTRYRSTSYRKVTPPFTPPFASDPAGAAKGIEMQRTSPPAVGTSKKIVGPLERPPYFFGPTIMRPPTNLRLLYSIRSGSKEGQTVEKKFHWWQRNSGLVADASALHAGFRFRCRPWPALFEITAGGTG